MQQAVFETPAMRGDELVAWLGNQENYGEECRQAAAFHLSDGKFQPDSLYRVIVDPIGMIVKPV